MSIGLPPQGKPPTSIPKTKAAADLSLDTDLHELQKRIAGLESKINSDTLNQSVNNMSVASMSARGTAAAQPQKQSSEKKDKAYFQEKIRMARAGVSNASNQDEMSQ